MTINMINHKKVVLNVCIWKEVFTLVSKKIFNEKYKVELFKIRENIGPTVG